jgi:hypothetical protein
MAARFWVAGGNGLWSSTTNWSATSAGSSGASVPGSGDTATFNASSGSGTATVDSSVTVLALTMTGFTGTLAFGSNTISLNNAGTVYTGAATFTVTGTPVIIVTNSGATATTVNAGAVTEANAISFKFTGGTYTLTFLATAGQAAKNVDFTGFAGTWAARTVASTIYGDLTWNFNMLPAISSGVITFGSTTAIQTISSSNSTRDLAAAINVNGVGIKLLGSSATGVLWISAAVTFTNGNIDGNGYSLLAATTFTIAGTVTLTNFITDNNSNPTQTSGTVTLNGNATIGAYTLTAGTLNLNNYRLTVPTFSSNNANTRTIAFGTGNITCNSSGRAGGTLWTTATVTNLTVTGTPVVNISYSGAASTTVLAGTLTEAQAISFNFTTGTYSLSFLNTASYTAKNVDFTGFAGTWAARTVASTIYGSLTLSSGMTFAASSGIMTFGATSGTQIITTNGKTIDEPLTVNGVGGTVQLADALTMGATRALTLTNGTFDGNSKTISGASSFTMLTGSVTAKNISTALAFTHTSGTLTQGANNSTGTYTITAGTLDLAGFTFTTTSFVTAVGTKNLTFNGGTLTVTNATTTAFNNAQPTGFTTTAGTDAGKISMTAATAKTFVGGGSTFNCTLSNDGAGALTISGSNTFTTIANGVQPTAFTFTASTTQTITNWTVSGTAGNLVTIISSTAGTAATLSKASGTVSSDYLSLKDSAATGGATWYAGANSTNVSGNSGWIFSSPSTGNFFLVF